MSLLQLLTLYLDAVTVALEPVRLIVVIVARHTSESFVRFDFSIFMALSMEFAHHPPQIHLLRFIQNYSFAMLI